MRLPHIRLIEGKYRLVDNEELKPQKYNGFCIDLGGFESQLTAKRVIQVFRKACVSHFRDSEDRVWEVYLANLDRFCKEQGGQQDLARALGAHTVALEDKRESEPPKRRLPPLSEKAAAERLPQPPETLIVPEGVDGPRSPKKGKK